MVSVYFKQDSFPDLLYVLFSYPQRYGSGTMWKGGRKSCPRPGRRALSQSLAGRPQGDGDRGTGKKLEVELKGLGYI